MNCYACNAELVPDNACPDTDYQFDNALWIKFEGGYGMFIDELPEELSHAPKRLQEVEPGVFWDVIPVREEWTQEEIAHFERECDKINRVVICHECAHDLCNKIPWVEKLINSHNSHSHKTEWKRNHPNHHGWDYDSDRRNNASM